ncbi:MAG: AAA family ATPase [Hyphomonadaceae bacterium]|nr:AAA family ATPase [Hyphomonadaceae bacterium]
MSDTIVRLETGQPPAQFDTAHLEGVNVFATVAERETQAALSTALNEIDGIVVEFAPFGMIPVAALKSHERAPDAFFFEARDQDQAANWIQAIRAAPGGYYRHLVVLMPSPTKTATIELLQAGADDVMSTRPDSMEITRTLVRAKAVTKEFLASRGSESPEDLDTRLIVFIHAAGGQGATTLAVNTAVQLQSRIKDGRGGACLIDLDLQFGDVHLHLDLSHHSRLLDVLKAPERLDRRMLDDLMISAPNGLKVLTTPETPLPLDALSQETIERILSLARRRYRYVVVDMPAALARWTETTLHKADHIFLVTEVNVPAIRAARRLLETIRDERVTRAPITVIANRYSSKVEFNRLPIQQAARALDREINVVMPNDYRLVMESLDQGVPVSTLRPQSKLSQAIAEILDTVIGAQRPAKGRGSFVASLARLGRK